MTHHEQAIRDVFDYVVPVKSEKYAATIDDIRDWCGPKAVPNSVRCAVELRELLLQARELLRRCKAVAGDNDYGHLEDDINAFLEASK